MDPHGLRPFQDVAKYIDHLERPDRAEWQKPDAVVAALGLAGDEVVADLGAGSGYFSFRLAQAVPRGRVVALDVEAEMVRHMHHKTMTDGISNVSAQLSQPDEPGVPPDADVVFVCDVLHHVPQREAWLGKIAAAVKSGTRLVLIEFREGDLPQGPPASMKIPKPELDRLAQAAGFTALEDHSELLPYQLFLVYRRK